MNSVNFHVGLPAHYFLILKFYSCVISPVSDLVLFWRTNRKLQVSSARSSPVFAHLHLVHVLQDVHDVGETRRLGQRHRVFLRLPELHAGPVQVEGRRRRHGNRRQRVGQQLRHDGDHVLLIFLHWLFVVLLFLLSDVADDEGSGSGGRRLEGGGLERRHGERHAGVVGGEKFRGQRVGVWREKIRSLRLVTYYWLEEL